jgi:23S rRNA (guanosine2251-2'-O)-methyltransferase
MKPPHTPAGRQGRPHANAPHPPGNRRAAESAKGSHPAAASAPRRDHAGHAPARGQAPAGSIWIYGLHPVAAALANPARRSRRLLLTEEAEAALTARLPLPWPLAHERIERARLDQMLAKDAVHQGIALLADPLSPPPLGAVLEKPGVILVLDQVTDPRNVGAILRSASAFGAAGVITQDRHAPEETGLLAKAASGALETVPMIRAVNLARTLVALKAAGLWTVGLAADAPPLRGAALAQRRVALVLGAEGTGLRRLTRETCDEAAGLSMPGTMESLNVSAAATVALYELTRVQDL